MNDRPWLSLVDASEIAYMFELDLRFDILTIIVELYKKDDKGFSCLFYAGGCRVKDAVFYSCDINPPIEDPLHIQQALEDVIEEDIIVILHGLLSCIVRALNN